VARAKKAKAVKIVMTGDKQVNRMLRQLSATQGKYVIRKAARTAIKVVVPAAKRYAPVESGLMRRAIRVRALERSRTRVGARITIGNQNFKGKAFYGGFQEWGWKTGTRKGSKTRETIRASVDFRAILIEKTVIKDKSERRKIPGKFFLKRAADDKRKTALAVYRSQIKRGVREVVARNVAR
jgi:hypothetical protein